MEPSPCAVVVACWGLVWCWASAGSLPKKIKLNFSAPHDVFASNQMVDAIYVPSREGVLGVMPGACPFSSRLCAGGVGGCFLLQLLCVGFEFTERDWV